MSTFPIVDFPMKALPIDNISVAPNYHTQPGQTATNAMQRSTGMAAAQFRLKFQVEIYNTQTARTARGFFFNLEADSNLVRIRIPDLYGIDGPYALATRAMRIANPDGIPFATDALYATGAGHAVPTLETALASAAALNARNIYVSSGEELPGGCMISIDEFCYGIAGSWYEDGVNQLKLSPVLRKPAASGAVVSLAPIFVGHCDTQAPGYEALSEGRFGRHELQFVEDLTRLVVLA